MMTTIKMVFTDGSKKKFENVLDISITESGFFDLKIVEKKDMLCHSFANANHIKYFEEVIADDPSTGD